MKFLVAGQGLAGTCLTWRLLDDGHTVTILDPCEDSTSSIVAAGLMTPITGKDLDPSWRYDEFLQCAESFYRKLESILKSRFLYSNIEISRLFTGEYEQSRFIDKKSNSEVFKHHAGHLGQKEIPHYIYAPHGGYTMKAGARLNVAEFILSSRKAFELSGTMKRESFDFTGLRTREGSWLYNGEAYDGVALCRGFREGMAGDINFLEFEPNRGQMLRVRAPVVETGRVWNQKGLWTFREPTSDTLLIGATYNRMKTSTHPNVESFSQISTRLARYLKLDSGSSPYSLLDHPTGIRPIIRGWKLVAGQHPTIPHLYLFNGLGSKGALRAPEFSRQLAQTMSGHPSMDNEINFQNAPLR